MSGLLSISIKSSDSITVFLIRSEGLQRLRYENKIDSGNLIRKEKIDTSRDMLVMVDSGVYYLVITNGNKTDTEVIFEIQEAQLTPE